MRISTKQIQALSFIFIVLWLGSASCDDTAPQAPAVPPARTPAQGGHSGARQQVKPGEIVRLPDGNTVEECFTLRASLTGKTVKVRGRVVKFTAEVMGSNWVHLQDGSGQPGTNDLTVTTKARVEIGKTITATGRLTYDKDLGSGYFYPAIMEDAQITVE